MAEDAFDKYLAEINKAYLRGDATEHTHRPALKDLIDSINNKITAINEPKRIECGAPDLLVSRRLRKLEQTIGYIEAKDIGINLTQAEKSEQIKKRYLPSLENLILTDYIEFRLYINGKKQLTARLAEETDGKFKITEEGNEKVLQLLNVFLSHEPLKIGSAKELTVKMGDITKLLRDIINNTFEHEQETGTLHSQYGAFKEVLIHDLTEKQFADMYAQTICYGLFSARCHLDDITLFGKDNYAAFHGMDTKGKEFTRETAAYLLPKTNPFLRKTFGHIAGPELDDRIAWLVDDLVALLRNADIGSILRDFSKKTKRRDPVFHFYETFLAEYDKKLKKSRGVYYTPDEVVSYIVRSVDILLKEKFGLQRGLADNSKIKIESCPADNGKKANEKNKNSKEVHRCLILDPAVGTGTFLHEVIEQIHDKFKQQKGSWSSYVKEHLLPRIFGFELMMAPYAICHMKLGLQLANTGYDFESDERLEVYLTNTLEEAEEISRNIYAQWISEEARAANKVKKDLPIMVVLGNPPYSGLSVNMNKWIDSLLKNKLPVENGAQSYYEVDGQPLGEKKLWLQDDYVKFIRFGQYRIEQTGQGILAFITNHGYLDNPTFRGMRQSLMQTFDEIYLLDLHGNQKKKETCPDGSKDVNVFDIQQGVSIGIFIKSGLDTKRKSNAYHADLYGLRKNKYEWLVENDIETTEWTKLSPNTPSYFFVPKDETARKEYENYWDIRKIINKTTVGIVTARDRLTIDFSSEYLWLRIIDFTKLTSEEARNKYGLGKDARDWKVQFAQKDIIDSGPNNKFIIPIKYRPFDKRFTYYTGKSRGFIGQPQVNVMQHMLIGENIGLCWTRPMSPKYEFSTTITTSIIDQCLVGNKSAGAGISYIGPLYLYPTEKHQSDFDLENWPKGKDGRIPNLNKGFVEELAGKTGLKFVSDGVGDLKKDFGPEDVLAYIYGIFHSPEYRKRYAEFLNIDFPRVPMPPDKDMFVKICKIGQELIKLHLLEAEILEDEKQWPGFPVKGDGVVAKGYPTYVTHADEPQKGKVYINKDQYFEGIRPDVWEFHIGGYQVCEKWLKDRRERTLSYDDINHYQKVIVALGETIRLMKEKCLFEMFENKGS
jgi:type I restriction-modification system DNA methylase subunit